MLNKKKNQLFINNFETQYFRSTKDDMTDSLSWERLAIQKKKEVDANIPKEWMLPTEVLSTYNSTTPLSILDIPQKYLNPTEFDITQNYTVKNLLEKLQNGVFSSVDVISAFSHRAAIATQLTNCCTEIMFDFGLERAKFLDDYLAKNKTPYGPLHGLPISLKDCNNVPGYDSTLGFVSKIGNKTGIKEGSDFFKMLMDLGAVFYVKTNIPQTMMTADSENNIFGRTLNPSNLTWTAGGSSGGEGALIKMRGSIIGIGSDVAGSIRIPALCNGTYGYRPTSTRLPVGNQQECSRDPIIDIATVSGPLSTDLQSIELITKTIIDNKPWNYDTSCSRILYQKLKLVEDQKLKIGFIIEDADLPVHPPIKRIIHEAMDVLGKKGHSIKTINKFPSYDKSWELAWNLFQSDELSSDWDLLTVSGERIIDSLLLEGMDRYGEGPKTINELIIIKENVKEITDEWLNIFKEFDVVITPGSPSTAPPHDVYGIAPYTTMWNLVDFPAVVIPYGKADAGIDKNDNAVYSSKLDNIYAHYQPELYDGGIGHIQVVAPHFEDEKLLACRQIIDDALKSCV